MVSLLWTENMKWVQWYPLGLKGLIWSCGRVLYEYSKYNSHRDKEMIWKRHCKRHAPKMDITRIQFKIHVTERSRVLLAHWPTRLDDDGICNTYNITAIKILNRTPKLKHESLHWMNEKTQAYSGTLLVRTITIYASRELWAILSLSHLHLHVLHWCILIRFANSFDSCVLSKGTSAGIPKNIRPCHSLTPS